MVTCDEIFEALTSGGPGFPSEVAAHLRRCPRCRDLADAMEPLRLAWPEGSPSMELSSSASPSTESLQTAQNAAARLSNAMASATQPKGRVRLWQYAAAFLTGAAAAFVSVGAYHSLPAFAANEDAPTICLRERAAPAEIPAEQIVFTCVACHLAAK